MPKKELLLDLYEIKKIPVKDISKELNISYSKLYKLFQKYNISLRRKDGSTIKKPILLNLLNSGTSIFKIAIQLNTSEDAIKKALIRHSLDKDILIDSNNNLLNYITPLQKQLILGSLLGDTHAAQHHGTTRLKFSHCAESKLYVEHKHAVLNNFSSKIKFRRRLDKRTNKIYESYSFKSIASKIFDPIYDLFYKNRIKFVSKSVLYELDDRGLAYWFMDDGFKYNEAGLGLCTDCFSMDDLLLIQKYFADKWGIKTNINKDNRITFLGQNALMFQRIVNYYVMDIFRHKLVRFE